MLSHETPDNYKTPQLVLSLLRCHRQRIFDSRNLLILPQNRRFRSHRRNAERIDLRMALCIMVLNMRKLRRILKRRNIPIQMPKPLVDMRISRADISDVGFEVLDIYSVKSYYCGEQPDIRLRNTLAVIVRTFGFGEVLLDSI